MCTGANRKKPGSKVEDDSQNKSLVATPSTDTSTGSNQWFACLPIRNVKCVQWSDNWSGSPALSIPGLKRLGMSAKKSISACEDAGVSASEMKMKGNKDCTWQDCPGGSWTPAALPVYPKDLMGGGMGPASDDRHKPCPLPSSTLHYQLALIAWP